jgi:hypothetical protein
MGGRATGVRLNCRIFRVGCATVRVSPAKYRCTNGVLRYSAMNIRFACLGHQERKAAAAELEALWGEIIKLCNFNSGTCPD